MNFLTECVKEARRHIFYIEEPCRLDKSTGDKFLILQYDVRVSWTTISKFETEVCRVIVEEYKFEVSSCTADPKYERTFEVQKI